MSAGNLIIGFFVTLFLIVLIVGTWTLENFIFPEGDPGSLPLSLIISGFFSVVIMLIVYPLDCHKKK